MLMSIVLNRWRKLYRFGKLSHGASAVLRHQDQVDRVAEDTKVDRPARVPSRSLRRCRAKSRAAVTHAASTPSVTIRIEQVVPADADEEPYKRGRRRYLRKGTE